MFYQFFDVFSDFFGFDHWRVAAIWLAIVVHEKFLKVPCYIVVSDRGPFDLIEIINKVVRRWTSVLSKKNASNGTITTLNFIVRFSKNCSTTFRGSLSLLPPLERSNERKGLGTMGMRVALKCGSTWAEWGGWHAVTWVASLLQRTENELTTFAF